MAESHQVVPDDVRAHAQTMRGFADRAGTAADAGTHVAGLDAAYGILCQPFGSMVAQPQNQGVEALSTTRDLTSELADNLDAAAEAYQRYEDSVIEKLNDIAASVDTAATRLPEVNG
ncbi:ESX-1 secretion-associated protein [Saccharomonospora piscinae]|uniref:type VII secretion target n=1 Tax=Saccharomonospora piscinae TaxID=687388 RepID=UPI0011060C70|nr:type VII secretion target [Saccharomonospora piscinae]TLW90466.1 ESX-1 secretion-associated protein [Saccharomonospora piscinae]